jgi:LuxR family maltose regulon positive regulatory protein
VTVTGEGTSRVWSAADLFESKLQFPRARSAHVRRQAALARIAAADGSRVVSVTAPPGYGKTTLLGQWAASHRDHVAWVSLDTADNDPESLLAYTVAALHRVEPIDLDEMRALWPRGVSIAAAAAPRVTRAMAEMKEPVALVLDHVEAVDNPECLDVIAELALHLPLDAQLALASRTEPPLPLARLRAAGDLVEIGLDDLAMDEREARALLDGSGIELDEDQARELVACTEGWPVGLYLGALALQGGGAIGDALRFRGDDRVMADYLRSEFLDRLTEEQVTFLTRTSVLDRMCGPLCDAVLHASGSADVLEALERSNLLLVALDRRREWYRYHQLFRDLLRTELVRREPDVLERLHRRAAAWYERHGLTEFAIAHAQAGGDAKRAARLVYLASIPAFARGRASTVASWLSWFEAPERIETSAGPAAFAFINAMLMGRATESERWAAIVDAADPDEVLPDGVTVEAMQAVIRTYRGRNGPATARADAERALALMPVSSRQQQPTQVLAALAAFVAGERDQADIELARVIDSAAEVDATIVGAFGLAARAVVAADANRWNDATDYVARAVEIVDSYDLGEYSTSAYVHAAHARVLLHQGRVDLAREAARRAARLRPMLTYAFPYPSALTLLELARVYIALADASGAREVLRQVHDIVQQVPDLGILPAEADAIAMRLETMRTGAIGASSLTTAELRLVPFLSTHLTFPEIGERLHISRHTVKTQAISIYQKLGVSSRSEAITRLEELGFVSS